MAKFLQDLLNAKEPMFGVAMHNLERATGHSGVDAQLIGDILKSAHDIMRSINLDPSDTTALELYNALKSYASNERLFERSNYVGILIEGEVISLNVDDVRDNASVAFKDRTLKNLRSELQCELVARYSDHSRTDDETVRQFADDAGLELWYNDSSKLPKQTERQSTVVKPYVLTIGDIFTDAFIKLREDKARIDIDPDGSKRLSMEFGSKPPYERVDIVQGVGPSPNAAVAFSRLGLDAGLMAYLGDDMPGKDSLAYLLSENIKTDTVSVQDGVKSNYYYVLRYGADRTILVKNEQYNYSWQEPSQEPDWVYLALISGDAWQLHEDLLSYLEAHPKTKLAFQPGTFHFEWGPEKLAKIYARSAIVVMNREEAAQVTGKPMSPVVDLLNGLHDLGPDIVVITDGPDGAYASDKSTVIKMPNYPDPAPPYDRTGAGDAFASTIVAALAQGESLETALRWAPVNSMSVVQQLGAQAGLLRREEIESYLQDAPNDYLAEAIQ